MKKNKKQVLNKPEILEIPVRVTSKNGNPAIELRKLLTDTKLIEKIITAAFYETPSFILVPKFTSKLDSFNSLVEKGILYINEEEVYCFTLE